MTATLLKSQEIHTINSNNITVNGDTGPGIEVVVIGQGVTGTILDINVERVALSGNSSDFTYQQQSGNLVVYNGSTVVLTVPVQTDANGTQLTFNNGTVNIRVSQSGMTLGGVAVVAGSGSSEATHLTPLSINQWLVTQFNNPPTGSVTISGNLTVGSIITATNTLADIDGLGAFTYTWYSDAVVVDTGTNTTYTTVSGDIGKIVTCKISYTDGLGNTEEKTSNTLGPITAVIDSTPPVFQSAAVSTDGLSLVLTFDETLNSTTASTTDFVVNVNSSSVTVSSVIASGSDVTLTLAVAIESGQTVTFDYTQPSNVNAIKDVAGNKAISLTNTAASNNSTVVPALPIGSVYGGGYYAGNIVDGGVTYRLIVAPKAIATILSTWYTATNISAPIATQTLTNGVAASNAMNSSSYQYEAAVFCKGLNIGGFTDWYLPARDELEILYRNLKPGTAANTTGTRPAGGFGGDGLGHGTNSNTSPTGAAYTSGSPAQTGVSVFQTGGTEAFTESDYWSSTEHSNAYAWTQNFSAGNQSTYAKTSNIYARAVRRVAI